MKKLKLEIGELRVETFHVGGSDGGGTVRGHDYTAYMPCEDEPYDDSVNYCSPPATAAGVSCVYTCAYTCNNTCGCATQGQWSCVMRVCGQTEPYDG